MLRRLKTRKSTSNRERLEVLSGGLHLKSPGQMLREFSHVPEAIENTLAIAERCKLEIEPDRSHFPAVSLGPGESLDDRFEKTVLDGFERRLEQMRAKRPGFREEHRNPYEERLQHEMAIIRENGFQAISWLLETMSTMPGTNVFPWSGERSSTKQPCGLRDEYHGYRSTRAWSPF